ncbi:MAG: hypothetical protein K8I27_14910 [Planctomycetes bacterium]|nr:hypothetical protein [Planctomycetota bacterium]
MLNNLRLVTASTIILFAVSACVARDPNAPQGKNGGPAAPRANNAEVGDAATTFDPGAPELPQLLNQASELLTTGEYVRARDRLMKAALLAPSDARVFDALVDATKGILASEDTSGLVYEFVEALDRLVSYQPAAKLDDNRATVESLQSQLRVPAGSESEVGATTDPTDGVAELLKLASSPTLPLGVRKTLLSRARVALLESETDAYVEAAARGAEFDGTALELRREELQRLERQAVEQTYVEELRPDVLAWARDTANVLAGSDESAPKDLPSRWSRFEGSIEQGSELARAVRPYAEVGVDLAKNKDLQWCISKLEELQLAYIWHYNRWALHVIREVKEDGDSEPLDRIKNLSKVDERRLNVHVATQWNELYNDLYGDCADDAKDEAIRLRILGEYRK